MTENELERWPDELQINAWAGGLAASANLPQLSAESWAIEEHAFVVPRNLWADEPADERDWERPEVGWGVVLPDSLADDFAKAKGDDAPEPIRELLRHRQAAPILRYNRNAGVDYLGRYVNGTYHEVATVGTDVGVGDSELPRYLLIVGPPQQIPWELQFVLNSSRYVGRLDLDPAGLEHYVCALIDGWSESQVRSEKPVLWATDHGVEDITFLMRHTIVKPLREKLDADPHVTGPVIYLAGDDAKASALRTALRDNRPALIVTASHGWTPESNAMIVEGDEGRLGALVDQEHKSVTADVLLGAAPVPGTSSGDEDQEGWDPDGAIWYSHACCSAGGDAQTHYEGLVAKGSSIDSALRAVASMGARTAELPRRLLSVDRPLRAWVGQVEPTFNWTLRHRVNSQIMTSGITSALYTSMFRQRPEPVGMAMRHVFEPVGDFWHAWKRAATSATTKGDKLARVTAAQNQLSAIDRQSTVILGDPTVVIPAMRGGGP